MNASDEQHNDDSSVARKLLKEQYIRQDDDELKRSLRVWYGILMSVLLTALIGFVTGGDRSCFF